MEYLKLALYIYGALVYILALTDAGFVYNNPKSKLFIKWLRGKTNFRIFLFVWGTLAIIIGILL